MSKENNPDGDQELLFKIYENLIRTEEKLKALTESNKIEHEDIKEDLKKSCKKQEEMDKRLQDLEKKGFALTWTWKLFIFLIGLIPTILTILNALGII